MDSSERIRTKTGPTTKLTFFRNSCLSIKIFAYSLLAIALLAFCFSAIQTLHHGYGWHDQQRIYQLLLLCACAPLAALLPQAMLPRPAQLLLAGLLIIGLCSSLLATWPEWALKEWTRFAGLVVLALVVSGLVERPNWQTFLLWVMAAVGFLLAFQFLVYYLMAFTTGIRMLDVDVLITGFSNPRFFGQFQVMLMPVMALLVEHCRHHRRVTLAALVGAALISQWCISFTLGGRGLWLGLLIGHLALLLVNRCLWRIVALQAGAALLGFLMFLLLFKLIPAWLHLDPILRDGLRTSLSSRERIWSWAWEMALANPWLGAGPMHFAAVHNPVAAHPHQVFLQWAAEWGFLATMIASVLAAWGILHGAYVLRRPSANVLDAGLWISIVGALTLAQVDGVFVMPYTETWLALLSGLALARWSSLAKATYHQRIACAVIAMPVIAVLGKVLVNETPLLPQTTEAYMIQHHSGWTPRFWLQGWIPMQAE